MVVGAVNDGWRLARTLANEAGRDGHRDRAGQLDGRAAQRSWVTWNSMSQQDRLGRLILLAQAGALDGGSPSWPSAARESGRDPASAN